MKAYRRMAMAVTTCAAGLSLAACTAGVTTASPATSRSSATSPAASSPAAATSPASPAPASSADTVKVDAPIGSFPIPPAAQVMFNSTCDKEIVIELVSVTPAQASSFYTSALPQAGYKITGNSLLSGTGNGIPGSVATIEFTGHGYKGTISALANLGALSSIGPSPAPVPSSIAKNFLAIALTPPGTPECDGSAGP
jgi:hypothetical protein